MRISLTYEETRSLISFLEKEDISFESKESIVEKLNKELCKKISKSKKIAMEKARDVRSSRIKHSIESTINMMRLENKQITLYSISKESGISYNTVRKNRDYINSLYPLEAS